MTVWMVIGDTRDVVDALPDGCVDLVFSSPPYFQQRDYVPSGHPLKPFEVGQEVTPGEFLDTMLDLTERWRRVLRDYGSLSIELGDSYSDGSTRDDTGDRFGDDWAEVRDEPCPPAAKSLFMVPELYRASLAYGKNVLTSRPSGQFTAPCSCGTVAAQNLRGVDPVAWASPQTVTTVECSTHGVVPVRWEDHRWCVRNVVDLCRSNPAVGNLGDKFRPATSDLVIAAKSETRWFDLDAVREPHRSDPNKMAGNGYGYRNPAERGRGSVSMPGNPLGAPPLDWWEIASQPYTDAHYAVMNPEIAVKPILSMCPPKVCRVCGQPPTRVVKTERQKDGKPIPDEDRRMRTSPDEGSRTANSGGNWRYQTVVTDVYWDECGCEPPDDGARWRPGIVLDPFGGTGTTGMVASGSGRDCILIDFDERNVRLAENRVGGLFLRQVTIDELVAEITPLARPTTTPTP